MDGGSSTWKYPREGLEQHHGDFKKTANPLEQGAIALSLGRKKDFVGTRERPLAGHLLVRIDGMRESGEFTWRGDTDGQFKFSHIHLGVSQNDGSQVYPGNVPPFLERRDERGNPQGTHHRATVSGGVLSSLPDDIVPQFPPALRPPNWGPSLCGCGSEPGTTPNNNAPQQQRDTFGLRVILPPAIVPETTRWYNHLPSAYYPSTYQVNVTESNIQAEREKWILHAPKISATTFNFPPLVARFLTRNSEISSTLAILSTAELPLKQQIEAGTCTLSRGQLKELEAAGLVVKLGEIHDVKNILSKISFVGNVFLHPEPEKKRWRLIFHPVLYNKFVRKLQVHSVELPRSPKIVQKIADRWLSLKIDLKCAFFQIPVERGLFCFRKGVEIFTLTRLPMGASVSVLVAQALSTMVAHDLGVRLAKELGGEKTLTTFAFVDDIFISLTPTVLVCDLERIINQASMKCSQRFNVSLKILEFVRNPQIPGVIEKYGPWWPSFREGETLSCEARPVSEIDVLGVTFDLTLRDIRITENFRARAIHLFSQGLESMTPLKLWKIVGTSFHVVYALGLDLSEHHQVYRLLGRVAQYLAGAERQDPRWNLEFHLSDAEKGALDGLVRRVLEFPRTSIALVSSPDFILFSDASDMAAGVVCVDRGRVQTITRLWNSHEFALHINTKEVLAVKLGVQSFVPLGSRRTPLLVVDNTSTFFGLHNGYASASCANRAIGWIRRHCNFCLTWCPTEDMPADPFSRNQLPSNMAAYAATLIRNMRERFGRFFFIPRLH